MSRPPLEVADLVRVAGKHFIESSRDWLSGQHLKGLVATERCRTATLGGLFRSRARNPRPIRNRTVSWNPSR